MKDQSSHHHIAGLTHYDHHLQLRGSNAFLPDVPMSQRLSHWENFFWQERFTSELPWKLRDSRVCTFEFPCL
jgi:hypothetical protein